ncbi:MAG TPA: cation transporter [Patescibacteria group bacterium]|nr:cation transporter [Patescibacteria group bacterium]
MSAKIVAIISVAVNLFLSVGKLLAGFSTGSVAIMADGIHSSLDIVSSVVSYWGIQTSSKGASVPTEIVFVKNVIQRLFIRGVFHALRLNVQNADSR